ncbi:MAG: hypothetical protein GWO20_05180, partial [Candidatus Korarchaeota archaeon]|nr:hypothetical protein [Candidatus Korarchaeota archaeon]NIU82820.1 hypothetical protein [Candidatus Thorarchaeota archaeon]NIW13306.1 hypothetical protein [Candidatus Thorarchaeota archaeon]NIW51412.1 hypothetical protein [Candidatus Korarchaeota archaeon]
EYFSVTPHIKSKLGVAIKTEQEVMGVQGCFSSFLYEKRLIGMIRRECLKLRRDIRGKEK